jgi:hypothetical protein
MITSWGLRELPVLGGDIDTPGGTAPTRLLDFEAPAIQALVTEARDGGESVLETAHSIISLRVRAIYSVDDSRPASVTLSSGRGSCSQRLAILESVARASGIATRSRGLLIRGSFWYPRFRVLRPALPDRVLLAWPEFQVAGRWTGASELFGSIGCTAATDPRGFANSGAETLFEAIGRSAIDWDGVTSTNDSVSCFDLSGHVLADLGRFRSRDDLFAAYGQTLCPPVRLVMNPILSRMAA